MVDGAEDVDVTIVPNPSHLEAADPIVEGRARAEQTDRSAGAGTHDPSVALPVIALVFMAAAWEWAGFAGATSSLQRTGYLVAIGVALGALDYTPMRIAFTRIPDAETEG